MIKIDYTEVQNKIVKQAELIYLTHKEAQSRIHEKIERAKLQKEQLLQELAR